MSDSARCLLAVYHVLSLLIPISLIPPPSLSPSLAAMSKLGLVAVPGVTRVTMKKGQTLFVFSAPDVFKSPSSEQFVVFGECKVGGWMDGGVCATESRSICLVHCLLFLATTLTKLPSSLPPPDRSRTRRVARCSRRPASTSSRRARSSSDSRPPPP